MSPNKDRRWDDDRQRWLRWSSSRKRWVVDDDQEPSGGPNRTEIDQTAVALARLSVNSSGHQGAPRQTAAYSGTAKDRATGYKTNWQVSLGTPYRDLQKAEGSRSITTKYIRAVGGKQPTTPQDSLRVGCVIEVLLVPPDEADPAAVSGITPVVGQRDGVRRKRFVIVQTFPEQNLFRALPIKTYNMQGVAAPGVIKFHHSIIYTDNEPLPLSTERPNRLPNGEIENPMQPQAIQVIQYDLTTALDPRSRLDYGSDYQFDFEVPNIRLFGRVHQDSLSGLFAQWHAVYNAVRSIAGSATAVSTRTVVPTPLGVPGSSRTTGGSAGSGNTDEQEGRTLLQRFSARTSGQCTERQMQRILAYLDAVAQARNLRRPNMTAAARILPELARNAERRAMYLQQVQERWRQDAEANEEDSDEDNSGEEDSDDDDD